MEIKNSIEEKLIWPMKGFPALFLILAVHFGSILLFIFAVSNIGSYYSRFSGGLLWLLLMLSILFYVGTIISLAGLKIVKPKEAIVLTLFGKYYGTIKEPGFYFVNPFSSKAGSGGGFVFQSTKTGGGQFRYNNKISLKTRSLNNEKQKINDFLGNPILIETIVIWHVENPTKAVFNVEDYSQYMSTQCDAAVRHIARMYPYENLEYDNMEEVEKTLIGSVQSIAEEMRKDLQTKVDNAGLVVEDVRISHLSYAEEIAAAMLQRQQAAAIVAAREKIVEGAVGMTEMALNQLSDQNVVNLDEEKKAQLVSNLMVVLVGNNDVQPIVNSSSMTHSGK